MDGQTNSYNVYIFENESSMHVIIAQTEERARQYMRCTTLLGEESEEYELICEMATDKEDGISWSD